MSTITAWIISFLIGIGLCGWLHYIIVKASDKYFKQQEDKTGVWKEPEKKKKVKPKTLKSVPQEMK